jgi:kinesin family protein 1
MTHRSIVLVRSYVYVCSYNERVRDLFHPDNSASLRVRDHPQTGPYVEGLSRVLVQNSDQFSKLLLEGTCARSVAATQMNATSSRAHTIFLIMLTITTHDPISGQSGVKTSKINLVDLAGSERLAKVRLTLRTNIKGQPWLGLFRFREFCISQASHAFLSALTFVFLLISALSLQTGASGQQRKEGIGINKSLTTLGQCISQLCVKSQTKKGGKDVHVPYRDSVLTWLLKESLGGNAKTIMIAAIRSLLLCTGNELLQLLCGTNLFHLYTRLSPTVHVHPCSNLISYLFAQSC